MGSDILAIDFGTSNSAAAVLRDGCPQRITIEAGQDTLPTAVFFPASGGPMRIGEAAAGALIGGDEGRYMRALKSVLGTSLMHESRLIARKRRSVSDIIAAFLAELRQRAEAATGRRFRRALSGRPVHFHSADPARDTRAEQDLRACYLAAGFDDVDFLREPEAAALASHGSGRAGQIGLIVDIGGGTSDFTAFCSTGDGRPQILASHGIRLGGTDFDHALSLAHAMPALGHGGQLRREMGPGLLPVPNAIYADLATWAKIPFLYTPETRRMAAGMARLAVEPEKLARLVAVLEEELGHELAFAVERGKIAANAGANDARIEMGFIAPGLSQPLSRDMLDRVLAAQGRELHQAAAETLRLAGIAPERVGSVILVGGSSLMALVAEAALRLCPGATLERAQAFTAVVDGLALASAA
ncbi:Hsp70 family protein [Paracoccus siganidrum]|uniref:Hsp70 family protein n=1 Tax=Paracoccus siganidrum TaxID=1276757 RepID=A0A419A0H6_9RHOB|nr:Hsp70 family protein [Paracoccus siganidrum]RJL06399.1 Hsp70 family protein [Paracoccus siganidrum]RMC39303.1 Hsp70 family protein [Paracoccus siganidrum]